MRVRACEKLITSFVTDRGPHDLKLVLDAPHETIFLAPFIKLGSGVARNAVALVEIVEPRCQSKQKDDPSLDGQSGERLGHVAGTASAALTAFAKGKREKVRRMP